MRINKPFTFGSLILAGALGLVGCATQVQRIMPDTYPAMIGKVFHGNKLTRIQVMDENGIRSIDYLIVDHNAHKTNYHRFIEFPKDTNVTIYTIDVPENGRNSSGFSIMDLHHISVLDKTGNIKSEDIYPVRTIKEFINRNESPQLKEPRREPEHSSEEYRIKRI